MQLLQISPERVSLEFARSEFSLVQMRLRRAARRMRIGGGVLRHRGETYEDYAIGGVRLILMGDLDEPCLISTSPEGDALLRAVHRTDRARLTRWRSRVTVEPDDWHGRFAA